LECLPLHADYAASRISSKLKGSTKQFGWLQAAATKVSFLSITCRVVGPNFRFSIPNRFAAVAIRPILSRPLRRKS
jgi:hypothetical protein